MYFPVSGVDVAFWIPPLVALIISSLTTSAGVSGAFLLLPFQMSVLHYTSPSVSSTNLIYNIVSIPGGLYRYIKEGRMTWPLTWVVVIGTLPGVFLGAWIRILYLPDPRLFKLFVGLVLLYLGLRLLWEIMGFNKKRKEQNKMMQRKFNQQVEKWKDSNTKSKSTYNAWVKTKYVSFKKIEYDFLGETYSFSTWGVLILSLAVGLIGGIYGIGGGAIVAPFFVSFWGLPVYTVAGAALAGTLITSVAGVIFYHILAATSVAANAAITPDWLLGALFGIGGLLGSYIGAYFQKYMPDKLIKGILTAIILFVSIGYVSQFFIS